VGYDLYIFTARLDTVNYEVLQKCIRAPPLAFLRVQIAPLVGRNDKMIPIELAGVWELFLMGVPASLEHPLLYIAYIEISCREVERRLTDFAIPSRHSDDLLSILILGIQ
jgi:hypothetical protein